MTTEKKTPPRDCSCAPCVRACLTVPGIFRPEQLDAVAALRGQSVEEFFATHCVAARRHSDLKFRVVRPIRDGETPGTKVTTSDRYRSRCVFLDAKDRCSIHAAKPAECVAFLHGEEENPYEYLEIERAWDDPKHQALVKRCFTFAHERRRASKEGAAT